ncbi:peptidase M15, partial [Streptomyces sp. HSW2009]
MRLTIDRRLTLGAALLAIAASATPASAVAASPAAPTHHTFAPAAAAPDTAGITRALKDALANGAPGA